MFFMQIIAKVTYINTVDRLLLYSVNFICLSNTIFGE